METMNIALPRTLKRFVANRVKDGGYSSVSEYIRELIRADMKQHALEQLDEEILKGFAGPSEPVTKEMWDSLRASVGLKTSRRKNA